MQPTTPNDDGRTDEQTPLSANQFGLSDDDIEGLLENPGPDIDDLLDEVESGPDIDDLLDAADADDRLDELLDEVAGDDRADRLADCYSEKVARQWGTPEGEWWP